MVESLSYPFSIFRLLIIFLFMCISVIQVIWVLIKIMLAKLTDTVFFNLLPLFSALFIAVGMPVLHPILHSHLENYENIPVNRNGHISMSSDEGHELFCPICDFLATSQLYDSGMVPVRADIKAADNILSMKHVFLAKSCPLQIAPRAPPVGHSS